MGHIIRGWTVKNTIFTFDPGLIKPSYTVIPSDTFVDEGESVVFNIITTGVTNSTLLYWNNSGTTTANDFVEAKNSGNVAIINNSANVTFTLSNDLTTEGLETIIFSIYTDELYSNLAATAETVVVTDTSITFVPTATYNIVPSTLTVNEGNAITFSVYTSNVNNGTTLYWTNTGTANATDFNEAVNSGSFTVTSNVGNVTLNIALDSTTEGSETIIFNVKTGSTSGNLVATSNTVTIVDTSLTVANLIPTYSVTPDGAFIDEGETITFTITTSNVSNGTTLYWTNSGNTDANDFVSLVNNGSFTITGNTGTVALTLRSDILTEADGEVIILNVRTDSITGNIVATANTVTVNDTSQNVRTYSVTPSTTSINEGQAVTYTINTSNVSNGTTLYWTNSGTSNAADFVENINSGSFTINSNTGSVVLTTVEDLSLEGSETIILEVRIVSTGGMVVATANTVTIADTSTSIIPTYSITPNTTLLNEGQAVTYTINTSNVSNGPTLYWTNSGTSNASDFESNANNGSFTISSNTASVTLTTKADLTTEGSETIILNVRTGSVSGNIVATANTVTITDTSIAPVATYSVIPSTTSVNEGGSVTFTINTSNVNNGTTLYWTNSGSTTAPDFNEAVNSGAFTISANTASVVLNISSDLTTEGSETIIFRVRTGSTSGTIVATANTVTVGDTSLTLVPSYSVSPNTTLLNEGQSVVFTINTSNVANGTTLYWTNSGTSNAADFVENINSGSFSISANTASVTLTLSEDLTTEGSETVIFNVRTGSTTGTIVSSASTVSIGDTSLSPPPNVEYLVVAGGGGGGAKSYGSFSISGGSGGGGAGGMIVGCSFSPLAPLTSYCVVVGGGGTGGQYAGCLNAATTYSTPGSNSCFDTYATACGGGGGGSHCGEGTPGCKTCSAGDTGGSGGGGARSSVANGLGGAGTPGQGYPGGDWGSPTCANNSGGGGGGGAGGAGGFGNGKTCGAVGGVGCQWGGSYYAGGGAGGGQTGGSPGGLGGGGPGTGGLTAAGGCPGSINTGGGGGGWGAQCNESTCMHKCPGGSGGSGIVIIKYCGPQNATGGTVVTGGGFTCHIFCSSGCFTTN